jgi:hypothetical protein
MLQAIAALTEWLPKVFDWGLAPGAFVLLLLAFVRKARLVSALGLMTIAAISVALLSIDVAAIAYVSWAYERIALDLLLNFGPGVTARFVATLLHGVGARLIDAVPMLATTAASSIAVVALRTGRYGTEI